MYKSSFLFISVALAVVAASLQSGGARWGDFVWAVQAESRVDMASLHEDVKLLFDQAKATPTVFRILWSDVRSSVKELKADATVESKIAAQRISPHVPAQ